LELSNNSEKRHWVGEFNQRLKLINRTKFEYSSPYEYINSLVLTFIEKIHKHSSTQYTHTKCVLQ